jgi:nicotinate-nucleotide adenylyltransferase
VTWIEPELQRVGILGGTFDPVHYGHLAIAEEVAEALALELILFVPAALPPHKLREEVTPAEDRTAMVARAIEGNPKFRLCRIELERSGPSYTADTLQQLADEAARQSVARELIFILSADALAEFRTWHDPERVLALATLAVVPRPGSPAPDREWALAQLPSAAPAAAAARAATPPAGAATPPTTPGRIVCVDTVRLATSSTEVRARAAAGRSIRYLVPPAVEAYIHHHRLYRSSNRKRIT